MWQRLGDIAQISTGYTFRGSIEEDQDGDLTVFQIKDVSAGRLDVDAALRIRDKGFERHYLMSDDLLFQSRGSQHPVAVYTAQTRCIAAAGLHVIRVGASGVHPEYLAFVLNHANSQSRLRGGVRASSAPFVSVSDLKDFTVPVPSLDVQQQLLTVDRLQQRERALLAELTMLRQTYLDTLTWQAATAGKE